MQEDDEDTQPLEIDIEAVSHSVLGEESEMSAIAEALDDANETKAARTSAGRGAASTTIRDREREPGKSILPFSRVQKIIKADKDLPMLARDATYLISLAAEEFIRKLAESSQRVAEREKRATVQQKDVENVVRRSEEFFFLSEIISYQHVEPLVKRKPKALQIEHNSPEAPTFLDKFVKKTGEEETQTDGAAIDITLNEDGTMYTT